MDENIIKQIKKAVFDVYTEFILPEFNKLSRKVDTLEESVIKRHDDVFKKVG